MMAPNPMYCPATIVLACGRPVLLLAVKRTVTMIRSSTVVAANATRAATSKDKFTTHDRIRLQRVDRHSRERTH